MTRFLNFKQKNLQSWYLCPQKTPIKNKDFFEIHINEIIEYQSVDLDFKRNSSGKKETIADGNLGLHNGKNRTGNGKYKEFFLFLKVFKKRVNCLKQKVIAIYFGVYSTDRNKM